ncbi:MAG: beta-aspartyl-peptidase [Enterocloster bolteae]
MKVLKQGDIYAPEHLGRKDILIEGSRIARIADHIDEYDQIEEVEKVDLGGHILTPGYMDIHVHITGGGGESGPATRVPEASLSVLVKNGITTVVGLLGTDGITRSLENLLAKARAFNEEGITCRILTGAYGYPSPTITGSVERDIALIDLMVGVKIAMSDHRSSNLTGEQLISLATQARRAGMLSGCCGYVTIHMGSGKAGLDPLFYAIDNSDVPVQKFLPTHMGRTQELFEQGLEFVKRGGTIDMTAGLTREELEETADQILSYLKQDPEGLNMTMSSDAYGSAPRFNEQDGMHRPHLCIPQSLHQQLKVLVCERGASLEKVLNLLTKNPARVLGLTGVKGTVAEGADADFVVYDDSMDILHVMAGGRKAVWDKEVIMKGTFEE